MVRPGPCRMIPPTNQTETDQQSRRCGGLGGQSDTPAAVWNGVTVLSLLPEERSIGATCESCKDSY